MNQIINEQHEKLTFWEKLSHAEKDQIRGLTTGACLAGVEQGREEVKKMIEDELLIKCECENGDCLNCNRICSLLDILSKLSVKE